MPRLLIYGDSNSFGTAPLAQLGDDAVHHLREGRKVARGIPNAELLILE